MSTSVKTCDYWIIHWIKIIVVIVIRIYRSLHYVILRSLLKPKMLTLLSLMTQLITHLKKFSAESTAVELYWILSSYKHISPDIIQLFILTSRSLFCCFNVFISGAKTHLLMTSSSKQLVLVDRVHLTNKQTDE